MRTGPEQGSQDDAGMVAELGPAYCAAMLF